jgi:hypothetical protein
MDQRRAAAEQALRRGCIFVGTSVSEALTEVR